MAVTDKKRVSDGFLSLEAGVDQGKAPNLIAKNSSAFAVNTTFRGGWPYPRPGFVKCNLNFGGDGDLQTAFETGMFQTAGGYRGDNKNGSAISMQGGRVFSINLDNFSVKEITVTGDPNPPNRRLAWKVQAENYFLIQDGQSKPFIYNGGSSRRATEREIPVGNQMAYFMGRIIVAKEREYVAGDIVFGPSGTASLGFRDSILKMTENDFLSEGGAFGVPMDAGDIVALKPIANINTALGQGELIVFTENNVFATVLPVDRATWKLVTQPLQRIIQLESGGVSQDAVVNVNEDLYYRYDHGIQSLAYAVRNSGQPGNTPISNEVNDILNADSELYLQFARGEAFDNRMLMTCSPALHPTLGTYHRGLVVLDFDLITGIHDKQPPAWEGVWVGLKILQIFKVRHQRVMRLFAYVIGCDDKIELWEITRDQKFDHNGQSQQNIHWALETRSMDFGSKFDSHHLFSGDVFIDSVNGEFRMDVDYIPDSYPCPIHWDAFCGCAKTQLCDDDVTDCTKLPNLKPQYRTNLQLKQPRDDFDPILKRLHRIAYEFGFRFNNEGYFRMKQFRANTYETQQPPYGENWTEECPTLKCCGQGIFASIPVVKPPPTPPPPPSFGNDSLQYCCPEGQTLVLNILPPSWIAVVGNCLVVAPDSFMEPTKDAANAAAQAALNNFVTEKQGTGDLTCTGGEPPCIPPEFETKTFESALTVASPVSTFITSGGDHYSFDTTFSGTAGKSISMWQGSSDFDSYLILIDPDGLIEAQNDDGGYNRFGDTFNSALTVTLAKTGTYTVQATTSSAFATGAFKLIVSEGVETVITGLESGWIMIYVASTKRVFVLCGFDGTHGNKGALVVIDSTNNTIVADVALTGLGGEAQPMLFYNPNDDSVWAGSDDGATNGFITRHSPLDGSLLETLPLGAAISPPRIFGAFVPSVNKVYGHAIGGPNFNYVDVYDCTTKNFLANITLPDTLSAMDCEYIPVLDRVLIQGSAGKYYLINPNDNSVQTVALNIALGKYLGGFYYYVDPATSNYMKLDLMAGIVTPASTFGYFSPDRSLGYNECRQKFAAYSAVNVGFPVWITMNSLDPVTFEPTESVVLEQLNPAGFNEQWIQTLWNPDLDRLYVLVGQVAGKIYVLS